MTVAYVKERRQFGVPVGSYQAVSHRCAQMLLDTEKARSTTAFAAWTADADPERLAEAAAMAKAAASDAGREVTASAIQAHGGIGFTWEADVHWFYKRAQLDAALLGGAKHHRARLAGILAGHVSASAVAGGRPPPGALGPLPPAGARPAPPPMKPMAPAPPPPPGAKRGRGCLVLTGGGDPPPPRTARGPWAGTQWKNTPPFNTNPGTPPPPPYELVATGDVYDGEAEVRAYFAESRTAFPDQRNELIALHHAEDAVIAEFNLLGTHLGPLRALPPTGRAFRCRMIAVFVFESDRLVCERVYFDQATILRQLGLAHDPSSLAGRASMLVGHPLTVGRALLKGRGRLVALSLVVALAAR